MNSRHTAEWEWVTYAKYNTLYLLHIAANEKYL